MIDYTNILKELVNEISLEYDLYLDQDEKEELGKLLLEKIKRYEYSRIQLN